MYIRCWKKILLVFVDGSLHPEISIIMGTRFMLLYTKPIPAKYHEQTLVVFTDISRDLATSVRELFPRRRCKDGYVSRGRQRAAVGGGQACGERQSVIRYTRSIRGVQDDTC